MPNNPNPLPELKRTKSVPAVSDTSGTVIEPFAPSIRFSYEKSDHEIAIEEIFGDRASVEQIGIRLPCVIMAFVNRSGSNYVAELLKSTGAFLGFQEALNAYHIRTLTPAYGVTSFGQYLVRYRKEDLHGRQALWGIKAGWMQIALLCKIRAIPRLLEPTLLVVRRKDIISQAISYYIAEQTAQWKSTEPTQVERSKVSYNGQEILDKLRDIKHSYCRLEEISLLLNCPVHEIEYEDVLENPCSSIMRVTKALVGRELCPVESAVGIKTQRDELNDQFRHRFLAEVGEIDWHSWAIT
jgi:LPS sulfotransferase NodH